MPYQIILFSKVELFIDSLPGNDIAKIKRTLQSLEAADFQLIHVKTLASPVKELIIDEYRIIFFIQEPYIYGIGAFIKKTDKTPRKEIRNAIRMCKLISRREN